jgi:hypothetical protein
MRAVPCEIEVLTSVTEEYYPQVCDTIVR